MFRRTPCSLYLKKLYIKSDSTHFTFKRNSFLELIIYPQTKFKQEKLILPKTCFVSTLFDPSYFKVNQHQLLCKKISMLIFNNVKNLKIRLLWLRILYSSANFTRSFMLLKNFWNIFLVFKSWIRLSDNR